VGREFRARIFWLGKEPLVPNKTLPPPPPTQNVDAVIAKIVEGQRTPRPSNPRKPNSVRAPILASHCPRYRNIAFDLHHECPIMGTFALEESGRIHGGGIDVLTSPEASGSHCFRTRALRRGHAPAVVWFMASPARARPSPKPSNAVSSTPAVTTIRVDGDDLSASRSTRLLSRRPRRKRPSRSGRGRPLRRYLATSRSSTPLAADRAKACAALANDTSIEVVHAPPGRLANPAMLKDSTPRPVAGEIASLPVFLPRRGPRASEVQIKTDQTSRKKPLTLARRHR
jgi:hypothetical protein